MRLAMFSVRAFVLVSLFATIAFSQTAATHRNGDRPIGRRRSRDEGHCDECRHRSRPRFCDQSKR